MVARNMPDSFGNAMDGVQWNRYPICSRGRSKEAGTVGVEDILDRIPDLYLGLNHTWLFLDIPGTRWHDSSQTRSQLPAFRNGQTMRKFLTQQHIPSSVRLAGPSARQRSSNP